MNNPTHSQTLTEDEMAPVESDRDWNADVTRKTAMRFAELVISKMFKPDAAERHLNRTDIMVLAITAFERGAEWESRR